MSNRNALLFILLGIFNAGFALWLLGYAAYWFLLVLDETAGGKNDVKVAWPVETFRERLWKLGHLAFLAIIWGLPVIVFFTYNPAPVRPGLQSLVAVVCTGVVLWLMMPISLLSSMTGETHWEFFRWFVVRRLMQRFATWMEFYASTFPLLLGCTLTAYLSLFGWKELHEEVESAGMPWLLALFDVWLWGFVLPLTSVMAATALLIYARLLGRLAWMADFWEEEEEEEEPKPQSPPTPEPAQVAETGGAVPFAAEPRPVAAPPRAEPVREPAPVKRLWVRGIYLFPWYRGSLGPWLFLAIFGLLFGITLRLQLLLAS